MQQPIEIQYLTDVLGVTSFLRPQSDSVVAESTLRVFLSLTNSQYAVRASKPLSDLEKNLLVRMLAAIQITEFIYLEADAVVDTAVTQIEIKGLKEMAENSPLAGQLKKKAWTDLQAFAQALSVRQP